MQIFVLGTPLETAKELDVKRFNKQILECSQILKVIHGESYAWKNHPVVKMYSKHADYVEHYMNAFRKYREKDFEGAEAESELAVKCQPDFICGKLIVNMKKRLFTKDSKFYAKYAEYGPTEVNFYYVDGQWLAYWNGKRINIEF